MTLKAYRLLPIYLVLGFVFLGVFGVLIGAALWGLVDQLQRRRRGTWPERHVWRRLTARGTFR